MLGDRAAQPAAPHQAGCLVRAGGMIGLGPTPNKNGQLERGHGLSVLPNATSAA
jgi:hypothetical protein